MSARVLYWRRTDVLGLERLELEAGPDGVTAAGSLVVLEDGGFRLEHRWRLTPDWRTLRLEVERRGPDGLRRLVLERDGGGWRADGVVRPDLDGAAEPDLSVTPFCNSLPIRAMGGAAEATLETAYVDAAAMTVARSRQRYLRLGPRRFRYVDLGLSAGFEATLEVDAEGLILRYEPLFERVEPS